MKKRTLRPIAAAVGTAFVATLATASFANAGTSPFQADALPAGYGLLAAADDAEAKCGEDKGGEAKCGEDKGGEGKCGEDAASGDEGKAEEGKCGEGKCGEGKCGGAA